MDKNIKEPNGNLDVFIHSWYAPDLIGKPFHPNKPYDMGRWQEGDDQKVLDLYQPVRHKFDHPDIVAERVNNFDRNRFHQHGHIGLDATYCMYRSIYEADKLRRTYERDNKFKYDAVIRMRFDLAIDTPIRVADLDLTKINTPINPGTRAGWRACDMFAISNGPNMRTYSALYKNIENVIYEYTMNDNEVLLGMHLEKHNKLTIHEIWKWTEDIWFTGYDLQPKTKLD